MTLMRKLLIRGLLGIFVFASIAPAVMDKIPYSAEIRLDNGDLRYRFCGVVCWYRHMGEPEREQVAALAVAAGTPQDEWIHCEDYPLSGSNHADTMCQSFLRMPLLFLKTDPKLAVLIHQDVCTYIETTHAQEGLPWSTWLSACRSGSGLRPDWQDQMRTWGTGSVGFGDPVPEVARYIQSSYGIQVQDLTPPCS